MGTDIIEVTVRAPRFTRHTQRKRGTSYRDVVRSAFADEDLSPPAERTSYFLEDGRAVPPDAPVLTSTDITVVSRAVNG